jgi:hypothetical protein
LNIPELATGIALGAGPHPLLANLPAFTHNSQVNASGGFMLAIRSGVFQFALMLATAVSVSMWPAPGQAYTPEQQQACSNDAMQLCGEFVPDVDRITACMIRKKSQLSPGCQVHFRSEPAVTATPPVAAGRPMSITPASPRKPVSAKPRKPKKPAKPDAT